MLKFNSIKSKLIFYLIVGLLPVFVGLLLFVESYTKKILYEKTMIKAKALSVGAARDIENIVFKVSQKPEEIATLVGQNLASLSKIEKLMREDIEKNCYIYGMALAILPKYSPNKGYFCPYFYQRKGKIVRKDLVPPHYDYLKWDWLVRPFKLKKNLWSRPYFDKGGGNVWMSTYSVLIKDKNGQIIGVATADVSIGFLLTIVKRIRILKSGGAFLFNSFGDILAPFGNAQLMEEGIKAILDNNEKNLLKNRYTTVKVNNKKYLIYYTPIRGTDWVVGVSFPFDELFLPLREFEVYFTGFVAFGLFLVVFLIVYISKKVTDDVAKIKAISQKIAKGNFGVELPKNLTDESKTIAEALDAMQKSLKKLIEDLKEKTKIENEIELARRIQSSFIPHNLKQSINGFEFEAFSEWAYRVGGDFYGVNKINHNKVLFYVGDVSGKGISAVLYAVIVKSMLDVLSSRIESLEEMVSFLNNRLASTIKNTFATIFIGLIDTKRGILQFCNAGHNPPIFIKDNFLFTAILPGNLPVGVFENADFKVQTMGLGAFDAFLVYTDGITDASDIKGDVFTEYRMLEIIRRCVIENENIIHTLKEDLMTFVDRKGLYDDTTLLYVSK